MKLEFTKEEVKGLMQAMVDANVPVKIFLLIDQKVKEAEHKEIDKIKQ